MATTMENKHSRPFSADPSRHAKLRVQPSNCPTILKHEISSPNEVIQPFMSQTQSEKQLILDRPNTANTALKMKFTVLQRIKPMTSPSSTKSLRPLSGMMSSTINFDFLSSIGKTPKGKFQDRSRIKPLKKLNTDQFHNVIYKVKQQKEVLEKEINRMEEWQKDFKENDIWNTPQSAIVESILRMNAKSNPEGSVSKYLQTEKEKEEVLRINKKIQRPMSSYSHFNRRTPKAAKSVQDFFKPEDEEEEGLDEITGAKKNPYQVYENNKRKITDRINNYVDNLENYHTLIHSTKELIASPEARENPQIRKTLDGYLKESRELSAQPEIIESISEIVESHDELDNIPLQSKLTSPTQQLRPTTAYNRTVQEKSRPYSANIQVHTALAPKDFTNGMITTQGTAPPGVPSAIHNRPQTAKQMKMSPSTPISLGLGALGEQRQESMGSIKFIPLVMEGQGMRVEPYNLTLCKHKELTNSHKGLNLSKEDPFSNSLLKGSKSAKFMQGTNLNDTSLKSLAVLKEEPSREGEKAVSRRLMSAKPGGRSTLGTQTQPPQQSSEGLPQVGKVNINGEYFDTFMDNPVRALLKSSQTSAMKKTGGDGWPVSNSRPYSRQSQERVMA